MPILTEKDIQDLSMKLPAVSTAAMQIVNSIEDLRTSRQQIIELLKLDEVLFAECFRHANSASVSSFRKFVTINEIVNVLGFTHIKKVALFTAAKSVIDDPKVWFESVFVAIAADHLARKNRFDYHLCDIVYMAALFQNFGSFLLNYFYPQIYKNLNKIVDYDERLKAQQKEFGFHSLDISILVLKNYNVPEYVIDVIRNQINVYTDKARKENVFIEIARVLQEMQNKPMRDIHKVLGAARVRRAIQDSGIELVRIDHDMMSLLKEHAAIIV